MGWALPVVLLLLSGCAGRPVPEAADREESYAFSEPGNTRLGRMLASRAPAGREGSGLSLVESGPEALASIRGMIALAEKTVDLQYYIWRNDDTGRLIVSDLLDAAARGVRIRLLLDDLAKDLTDDLLVRLNAQPNFEVRLFNPFSGAGSRLVEILVDFQRVTHRMHNKLIVADNIVAMIGGRNIGDQYFSLDRKVHFRDLDLHVAGPSVRDLSASFDAFWNSAWSLSIGELRDASSKLFNIRKFPAGRKTEPPRDAAVPEQVNRLDPADHIGRIFSGLTWTGRVAVIADAPDKPRTDRSLFFRDLAEQVPVPKSELLIESAFLIPGEGGVEALCRLARSGISVRVLTNSLTSIDSIVAYAGYRKYRTEILECGVQLHELRARGSAGDADREWSGTASSSILHTKAAVIDRRYLFIGSFNIDPRSVYLNTEIALLIDSRKLAGAAADFIDQGLSLESSYRLALADDGVVWHTQVGGRHVRLADEPGVTVWGQVISWLISLLPVEKQI